jgi:hypothetical protein
LRGGIDPVHLLQQGPELLHRFPGDPGWHRKEGAQDPSWSAAGQGLRCEALSRPLPSQQGPFGSWALPGMARTFPGLAAEEKITASIIALMEKGVSP